jgi:hypothetical protein
MPCCFVGVFQRLLELGGLAAPRGLSASADPFVGPLAVDVVGQLYKSCAAVHAERAAALHALIVPDLLHVSTVCLNRCVRITLLRAVMVTVVYLSFNPMAK